MVVAAARMSKQDRRQALLAPHQAEHEASVSARMTKGIQPKGLPALLAWFREVSEGELPVAVHKAGVWRDQVTRAERDAGVQPVGGSKMGNPALNDHFRRLTEGTSSPLDADGSYLFPMRAALERMSRSSKGLTARMLYQLAIHGGDWRRLAEHMSYPDEAMEAWVERGLFHLWREYATERRLT